MSVVTDLIIACRLYDPGGKRINEYKPEGVLFFLVHADDPKLGKWYGGGKVFQCDLWMGAINHLDLDDLILFLKTITWESPASVQLIVKEEEDIKFRIIDLFPEIKMPL